MTKNKSGSKIISDKYSSGRATKLYEKISDIEQDLRSRYIKFYGSNGFINDPSNYRKKSPDHEVSQFGLFEMLEVELLSPASKQYYLECLQKATSDDELTAARLLTKLDELGLPFDNNDILDLASIRNAVMHFRTITLEDVYRLLELSKKLDLDNFNTIVKSFGESLKDKS